MHWEQKFFHPNSHNRLAGIVFLLLLLLLLCLHRWGPWAFLSKFNQGLPDKSKVVRCGPPYQLLVEWASILGFLPGSLFLCANLSQTSFQVCSLSHQGLSSLLFGMFDHPCWLNFFIWKRYLNAWWNKIDPSFHQPWAVTFRSSSSTFSLCSLSQVKAPQMRLNDLP